MKKSNFFRITFMLVIGGFITKILGMVTKIIITRIIGTEGIGVYMLIMPTFSLLISISQFGFPVAISKLVAEDRFNNKNLVLGIIPLSIIINFLIMLFLILSSGFISNNLLHEPRTYYGILSIGFVLPFICLSSILRAYFFGKEKMLPHVVSNILEDVIKLVIIIIFLPTIYKKGITITVMFLILISFFSELSSIFIFLICLPKKINLRKKDWLPEK